MTDLRAAIAAVEAAPGALERGVVA
jgi:hypothetical protein